eukprot:m.485549 g.485549  ORF g.485549 m.485549 type:complete len:434 (-) comp23871_c0_seq1:69-1370(-)
MANDGKSMTSADQGDQAAATTPDCEQPFAFTDEFLQDMPKADLHLHLDGSLRLQTLIELSKEQGVELPAWTVEGLRKDVFKDEFGSLAEALLCFKYAGAVLQSLPALERVAYELAEDNFRENVIYFEVRFAPQLHAGPERDQLDILRAVNKGLSRAKAEWNARPEVISGEHPGYEYGIIVCAMRHFTADMSPYFADLLEVHKYESTSRVRGLASMAMVTASVIARDKHDVPVVAIDIAGCEDGFPAGEHEEAFVFAQHNLLSKTVHAGEAYGPESIWQAVTLLAAQRIGHGFHLFDADAIKDPKIEQPQEFVDKLIHYVVQHKVALEVCLTSNKQILPCLERKLDNHPFGKLLAHNMDACLCTDNKLVSNTTLANEFRLAVDSFKMTPRQVKRTALQPFKHCFFPKPHLAKKSYIQAVAQLFQKVEARHGVPQ